MDLETAVQIVLQEADRIGQNQLAGRLGVSSSAFTRWRRGSKPEGAARARVMDLAEEIQRTRPTLPPVRVPADYWRGVLYACEAYAEITAKLLREARQADEAGSHLGTLPTPKRKDRE